MAIPNVTGALRGWTQKREIYLITKTVINHVISQAAEVVIMDIMVQPLQPEKIRRKPEEQRAWKWYDIVTRITNPILKIDDKIIVNGIAYRIDSVQPWSEAGYRRYEATEDFTGYGPLYKLEYNGNGSDGGALPSNPMAYEANTTITVLDNIGVLTLEGYIFDGWSTLANGSGIAYDAGDDITIASANVVLYAQWTAE